jgi:uncharacterized protein (TIGR00266 family)
MSVWYVAEGGRAKGPYPGEKIRELIARGKLPRDVLVWKEGLENWVPVTDTDIAAEDNVSPPSRVPVPPNVSRRAHEIDYKIMGNEMQFVELELDPGESAVAEAGAMMYMTDGIVMETVFGDGSDESQSGGIFDKLIGAGKRLITGEGLFCTVFTHRGSGKGRVAFSAPYPGKIIPVDLNSLGGTLICQKDAFLCAAYGTRVGIAFHKRLGTGFFGGEGFILQRLDGDGKAFIHVGGTVVRKELHGETLRVDTGCLAAFTAGIDYSIERAGNLKSMFFGGEGLFLATLSGTGTVWLQSLPFSRLADRIIQHAPRAGGSRKGEGSLLGSLGDLLDGD